MNPFGSFRLSCQGLLSTREVLARKRLQTRLEPFSCPGLLRGRHRVSVATKTSTSDASGKSAFEPLLDAREAANLLGGLHVKTVQRMARRGELPGYHIGKFWFFRASELNKWLQVKLSSQPVRVQ
jgi:excisionase family DNA binding protein